MNTRTSKPAQKEKKSIRTREIIVRAARKVFSEHPYHAASMRMIGKAAGVEHPLINYYFPNKAELFESIIRDICDEFITSNEEWFEAVKNSKTAEGFLDYIDNLLDFNQRNPEPLRILALNMSQAEHISQIPGYQHFPELIEKICRLFEKKIALKGPIDQIRMFVNSFNIMVISFLGASPCIAQVQGMEAGSKHYREWVKSALGFIFLPGLKEIINPRASGEKAQKKKAPR
ncbi:MAG: TetR/AcrR family transcriptional regulator [Spirochaetes bacterium]|nr:TetR/AcrR family transcriptional regulator [Spirochaetota bacterium]